ncbi:hypothetical protein Lal_00022835 [Lupinus albus]|nr:hypothetical protein Lal_00022835 [Lupinus albus]
MNGIINETINGIIISTLYKMASKEIMMWIETSVMLPCSSLSRGYGAFKTIVVEMANRKDVRRMLCDVTQNVGVVPGLYNLAITPSEKR